MKHKNALLSIVITARQAENVVTRCLDSVAGQKDAHLEIIVVDDASTDATAEICRNHAAADNRVTLLRHIKKTGIAAARNHGLDAASGAFVQFIDAGDWLAPDYCRALLDPLADESVDLSVGGMQLIPASPDNDIRASGEVWPVPFGGTVECGHYLGLSCDTSRNSMQTVLFSSFNKIYRRARLDFFRFPEGFQAGEDWLFTFTFLRHCNRIAMVANDGYHLAEDSVPFHAARQYNPRELSEAILRCRAYLETVHARIGPSRKPACNAFCASMLIAAVIRFCRRDATLSANDIITQLDHLLISPDTAMYLRGYRPRRGQSRLIPFLMRHQLPEALFYLARRYAHMRKQFF